MMNKWPIFVLIVLSITGRGVHAQDELPVELELSGYNYITPVPVYLSEDDKRWLKQKKRLRLRFINQSNRPSCRPRLQDVTVG